MRNIIRKDEQAVSPVIATILMVAITVVLAAVLYVMVSGLLVGPGATRPAVTFGTGTVQSGNYTVGIAGVTTPISYTSYKVTLADGTTTGNVAVVAAETTFATVTIGSNTYRIYWTDLGDEGNLNEGDSFRITGNNAPLPTGKSLTFYLLWAQDNAQLQTRSWTS